MLREIFAFLGFQFEPSGFEKAVKATDQIKVKAGQAADSVEKLGKKTKTTGEDLAALPFGSLTSGFGGLAQAVSTFATILASGAVLSFANTIAEQAFEVGKLSEQLGMSSHDLQAWELGAKRVGVTSGDLSVAFRKLSLDIAGGAGGTGTKTGSQVFARLGIDSKDAFGKAKTVGDILPDIAEKIKGLSNETEKVAITQQLFGRSGERLLPILNKGAAGVAELREEFDKLGGGFSEEAIKRSQEYLYSTYKLHAAFDSFKSLLAVNVLPMLTRTADSLVAGTLAFTKFAEQTTLASNGVEILAGFLTLQLASALAPYLGTGLKFAAIYLAVDDLIAFLDDKDSVIGDLLNRAFGNGTATAVRSWVNDAKDSFGGWIADMKGAWPMVVVDFRVMAAEIAGIWNGTILSLEEGVNAFMQAITPIGKAGQIDTTGRKAALAANEKTIQENGQDSANRKAAQQAVANYASASTALSGQGAAAPTGPLRAPIITQNFVELKPNLSITVPPGTSQAHSMRLVREASEGFASTERRAAADSLQQRGGS